MSLCNYSTKQCALCDKRKHSPHTEPKCFPIFSKSVKIAGFYCFWSLSLQHLLLKSTYNHSVKTVHLVRYAFPNLFTQSITNPSQTQSPRWRGPDLSRSWLPEKTGPLRTRFWPPPHQAIQPVFLREHGLWYFWSETIMFKKTLGDTTKVSER